MTYQPKVYRQQGGSTLTIASGGSLSLESGSSFNVASGSGITVAAGAYMAQPYQTLGSSQVATSINIDGVTLLTGTTTGPTYLLGAPSAAGISKWLVLNPSSSGATHRCVVSSSAWSGKITHHSATGDKLTLNTSAQAAALMVSSGTTEWRVVMGFAIKEPAIS